MGEAHHTDVYKVQPNQRHRLADALAKVAMSRGITHRSGKRRGQVNATELARQLDMNQPTITRILSGEISTPSPELLLALRERFGISPEAMLGAGDRAEDRPAGLSDDAVQVARRFDTLPSGLQSFIHEQLDAYERFAAGNPALAALLANGTARTNDEEIEKFEREHRRQRRPSRSR